MSKRGKILTVYLILISIIALVDLFRSYSNVITLSEDFKSTPIWYFYTTKLLSLIGLYFLFGIWKMKKWAVIGHFATMAVSTILFLVVGYPVKVFIAQLIGITVFCAVVWSPYKRMS